MNHLENLVLWESTTQVPERYGEQESSENEPLEFGVDAVGTVHASRANQSPGEITGEERVNAGTGEVGALMVGTDVLDVCHLPVRHCHRYD